MDGSYPTLALKIRQCHHITWRRKKMRRFVVIGLVVACLSLLFFTIGETAIEDNLVLHLPFDEGKGDPVEDKSGKGNNGAIQGGAKWVEGKSGKALESSGKDSFVEIQDSASLNPTTGTFAAPLL